MREPVLDLSPAALRLAVTLLGNETPVLSATAFNLLPEAQELQRAGLLRDAGHELVTAAPTEEGDEFVGVFASDDEDGLGRFSPTDGWLQVPAETLTRWELDVDRLVRKLVGRQLRLVAIESILWHLGNISLPARAKPVDVWFARRADACWVQIRTALREHPASGARVVLIAPSVATADHSLAKTTVLPVSEVLIPSLRIDPLKIAARMDGRPPSNSRVVVRGGGAEVELDGFIHRFAKGVKQREAIVYLDEQLRGGRASVPVTEVVEELGLSARHLSQLFKDHPTWSRLLFEKGGMCGFRLDD